MRQVIRNSCLSYSKYRCSLTLTYTCPTALTTAERSMSSPVWAGHSLPPSTEGDCKPWPVGIQVVNYSRRFHRRQGHSRDANSCALRAAPANGQSGCGERQSTSTQQHAVRAVATGPWRVVLVVAVRARLATPSDLPDMTHPHHRRRLAARVRSQDGFSAGHS